MLYCLDFKATEWDYQCASHSFWTVDEMVSVGQLTKVVPLFLCGTVGNGHSRLICGTVDKGCDCFSVGQLAMVTTVSSVGQLTKVMPLFLCGTVGSGHNCLICGTADKGHASVPLWDSWQWSQLSHLWDS
ncbi:hypothetical protein BaRGS_00020882 [Batillaria attramentaria]|uniref:Uncharacterized protein n=1 Tax=Batillaria attramentaria TaxID=370345 RepID=A0ABD0KLH3_9CAEN